MAATKEPDTLDSRFYKAADSFFPAFSQIGLTYDDVTLATLYSEVLPRDTQLDTTLADGLHLIIGRPLGFATLRGINPARLNFVGFLPTSS